MQASVCPQNRTYGSVYGSSCRLYPLTDPHQRIDSFASSHFPLHRLLNDLVGLALLSYTSSATTPIPYGLISQRQFAMKHRISTTCSALRLQPCRKARPLDGSFTLRYVTASSSASTFTTTTASSAGPLPVTATSLLRLGCRCRSYNAPAQTAPHRVRSIALSSPTHLLYLVGLRKGYRASAVEGTSPPLPGLPDVRTKLEWQFWLRLPSDP